MNQFLMRLFGLDAADVHGVSSMSLRFRNGDASGWLMFLAILAALFVWWSYARQEAHRELPRWRRWCLAGLRMGLLFLILMLLMRPVLALDLEENIRRTVLLLVDATKSMNIRDQRGDEADQKRAELGMGAIDNLTQPLDTARAAEAKRISRAELVKAVLENSSLHLLDDLNRSFNVETYTFGQTAAPVAGPTWLLDYRPGGNSTAIGDSVRDVLERKRGQPVAGIVLITDGGNNAGSPPAEAAEGASRDGVPIFAYGVGITSPRDIIVSHLSAPEIAFAKDEMSVTVEVRGQGLAGEKGHLTLTLGNDEVASKDLTFSGADEIVPLSFTPRTKGEFDLKASIPARDDEASVDNNSVVQRVRVIDDKIKVLYIEQTPRWEFRFLQEVLLRDRRIAPSFVLLEGDPALAQEEGTPYLEKFPETKEALLKYDMVIVGDVDPKTFTADQLDGLETFVSKFGGASLFIAGRNNMPDGYRGTPVEKMLPVELEPYKDEESGDRTIKLALTPLGRTSEMLRLAPDEESNAALWAKFPFIYWDAKVARPKPAAQVLVEDPDPARASRFGNMPVLATQQYGVGQVFYLGTDDLWRWRKGAGVNEYPALWGQVVQGAALAHLLGTSKKTQLSVDKRRSTREGSVDHLADQLRVGWGGDGITATPAAHAIRFAEGERRYAVLHHPRFGEDAMVPTLPNHMAIRLIAEDGDARPSHQIGDAGEIGPGGDAAGRIVGRVQENRLGPGLRLDEGLDIFQAGSEAVLLPQGVIHSPRSPPRDIRVVGGKSGLKHHDGIAWLEEQLAEELLDRLRTRHDDHIVGCRGDGELRLHGARDRFPECGQSHGWAIMRQAIVDGLLPSSDGAGRTRKRAIADLEFDDILAPGFELACDRKNVECRLPGQRFGECRELGLRHRRIQERAGRQLK